MEEPTLARFCSWHEIVQFRSQNRRASSSQERVDSLRIIERWFMNTVQVSWLMSDEPTLSEEQRYRFLAKSQASRLFFRWANSFSWIEVGGSGEPTLSVQQKSFTRRSTVYEPTQTRWADSDVVWHPSIASSKMSRFYPNSFPMAIFQILMARNGHFECLITG